MSKSKSAIHDFFRCYRPKNETHELAIAQFCAQRRFVVSIDATPDKRLPVTYEEFRQWFETDTPRRGDVVNLVGQGISGIVETVGVNQSVCLYVSIRGDELDVASGCFDYTSLEIADKETVPATGSLQGRAGLEPVAQQTQTARNTQRECPVPNQRIGSENRLRCVSGNRCQGTDCHVLYETGRRSGALFAAGGCRPGRRLPVGAYQRGTA